MKTDCQNIQIELLQGDGHHDAHLRECPACRQFSEMTAFVANVELDHEVPAPALDQAVLGYANKKSQLQAPKPIMFRVLFAAAAAIAIGAFVFFGSNDPQGGVPGGDVEIVDGGDVVAPAPEAIVSDDELAGMLQQVADADFSGEHIDGDLLDLELQLAMLQTEGF